MIIAFTRARRIAVKESINLRPVTIDLLDLNDRDLLPKARRNAFGSYRARVMEYAQKKQEGATILTLQLLVNDLRQTPHPTVWAEMKRQ